MPLDVTGVHWMVNGPMDCYGLRRVLPFLVCMYTSNLMLQYISRDCINNGVHEERVINNWKSKTMHEHCLTVEAASEGATHTQRSATLSQESFGGENWIWYRCCLTGHNASPWIWLLSTSSSPIAIFLLNIPLISKWCGLGMSPKIRNKSINNNIIISGMSAIKQYRLVQ